MTEIFLKSLDELRQSLYNNIKDYLSKNNKQINFNYYQTDIFNSKLIVHSVYLDIKNKSNVYVKYSITGDDKEYNDDLNFFTTDEMYNIVKNIESYEME